MLNYPSVETYLNFVLYMLILVTEGLVMIFLSVVPIKHIVGFCKSHRRIKKNIRQGRSTQVFLIAYTVLAVRYCCLTHTKGIFTRKNRGFRTGWSTARIWTIFGNTSTTCCRSADCPSKESKTAPGQPDGILDIAELVHS